MKLARLISLANPIINILCIVVNVYCEVHCIKNIAIYVIQIYKVIGDDSLAERKKRDYKKGAKYNGGGGKYKGGKRVK